MKAKTYLAQLKAAINEADNYFHMFKPNEEETFFDCCRSYATFCEPLIYSDIERLGDIRAIVKKYNELLNH